MTGKPRGPSVAGQLPQHYFKRLAKAMDPNETTTGYLQAIERDLGRLTLIERRLTRLEKAFRDVAKALDLPLARIEKRQNELDVVLDAVLGHIREQENEPIQNAEASTHNEGSRAQSEVCGQDRHSGRRG